jgi:hypothetical protein
MSYQPFPFDGEWMASRSPPRSVRNAVKFMYAGAAIEAAGLIVVLVLIGRIKTAFAQDLVKLNAASQAPLTASQLRLLENITPGALVVAGLAGVCGWLWMATMNMAGWRRARASSTVCFAFDTVFALVVVAGAHMDLVKIIAAVIWLVGLCAIVLLWQRESSEFFSSQSRNY